MIIVFIKIAGILFTLHCWYRSETGRRRLGTLPCQMFPELQGMDAQSGMHWSSVSPLLGGSPPLCRCLPGWDLFSWNLPHSAETCSSIQFPCAGLHHGPSDIALLSRFPRHCPLIFMIIIDPKFSRNAVNENLTSFINLQLKRWVSNYLSQRSLITAIQPYS